MEKGKDKNLWPSFQLPWLLSRRRQWHPPPVLLPGKSHGRRSLVGCSPWGREESDTTEWLHFHFSLSHIGEGNGNPLQCSCLESPRDGGAWWLPSMGSHRVGHDWSDLAAAGCSVVKNACTTGDPSSVPGSGRSPREGNGSPLQYSCLENPRSRGAWWATVHGVAKSQTRLKWLNDNNGHFSVFPRRQLLLIFHGPNLGNHGLSYPDVSTLRPPDWLLHLSNMTGDNYV